MRGVSRSGSSPQKVLVLKGMFTPYARLWSENTTASLPWVQVAKGAIISETSFDDGAVVFLW